jgi:NADH dehydrogenase FAD-containing subunit
MLSGIYQPWEVRFHVKKMAANRGARFIEGKVVKVDPPGRLLFLGSGEEVHYDVVSFNTGSEVPLESLAPIPSDNLYTVKPVINLFRARQAILKLVKNNKPFHGVVVGGGPAGVEICANLWRLLDQSGGKGRITLLAGTRLMADAPDRVRTLAMSSFSQRGIEVIEGSRVKTVEKRTILLSDGKELDFDLAFIAIGIRPSSLFKDSGIPTGQDGGLLVNPYLQSVAHPEVFGGGDCISLSGNPLSKVGVYAVRENPVLYRNLQAALEGGKLEPFKPQRHFLLIFNMGNGRGIFWKKNWVWEGRLAFLLKDYIDRKFMRTFQVSGELEERSNDIL